MGLPDNVGFEEATFIEPINTILKAVQKARVAANESSAVSSVRTIKTAEVMYYEAYPSVGYAAQLSHLGGPKPCTPSITTSCVLDDPLSNAGPGTGGKSGYVFVAVGSSTTGSGRNDEFVIGAAPIAPGMTGNRLFCATNDDAIRTDPGPGSTPVAAINACKAYTPI